MELKAKGFVEIDAVVYPPCLCGLPWAAHGDCGGYRPSGPTKDYGTVHFTSADRIANWLFIVEAFIKRLRKIRIRSL